MMPPATAGAVTEALWSAMVEFAEAGNDLVIGAQALPSPAGAERIARAAAELSALASAAAVAARHLSGADE